MWNLLNEQLKKAGIAKAVQEEFRTGIRRERMLAMRRQQRLTEAVRRKRHRTVDGLGHLTMAMDPFFAAQANFEFGVGWRSDARQRRDFLARHPEFKVERERKAMVTVIKPE